MVEYQQEMVQEDEKEGPDSIYLYYPNTELYDGWEDEYVPKSGNELLAYERWRLAEPMKMEDPVLMDRVVYLINQLGFYCEMEAHKHHKKGHFRAKAEMATLVSGEIFSDRL